MFLSEAEDKNRTNARISSLNAILPENSKYRTAIRIRLLARLPRNLSLFEQPRLNSNRIHMRFTPILTLGAIENLPFLSRDQ